MTLRLYITGRGEWHSSNGYIKVPKNCTFMAPVTFTKVRTNNDVKQLLAGNWKNKPDIHVGESKRLPNYTWYPQKSVEIKENLSAFELGRRTLSSLNNNNNIGLQKYFSPILQPSKPSFIHCGDTILIYPDSDNPRNASAIISCPKDTFMSLSILFKEMDSTFSIAIKKYGNIEIIWACSQNLLRLKNTEILKSYGHAHKIYPYQKMRVYLALLKTPTTAAWAA